MVPPAGPSETNVNDPVTVPLGAPVVASLSVTLVHVQGPRDCPLGCALAVMTNSRAAEPTNKLATVLITADKAKTLRCGAVVGVIKTSILVILALKCITERAYG